MSKKVILARLGYPCEHWTILVDVFLFYWISKQKFSF